MLKILALLLIFVMNQEFVIYDFSQTSDLRNWQNVDDRVMGGVSLGNLSISEDGHGIFKGDISLDNFGGFSSIRYRFDQIQTKSYNKFIIRIKGDKKRYQFRVKANARDAHSYIYYFQTNGEWQDVEIPFNQMYASFRGQKLNYPNFSGEKMEEISFLIGNKNAETFEILIDKVTVQ